MPQKSENARILMYSHDTFGLGHLRRCRTIAHSLVNDFHGLNILIVSGSSIAGAFDYRARVDFVKIPSVIKLRNGNYTSLDRHIDLNDTLDLRQSIIRHTAETFQPDIFIVDKEPMGLRGEVEETLAYLKTRNTRLVLGLREVMDAPHLLDSEWKHSEIMQKIDKYFDSIWVYGPPDFYDPLVDLDVPAEVRSKMNFVGFLQRNVFQEADTGQPPKEDYLLVTTGGGGDGSDLIHDVIHAYQEDPSLTHRAIIVLGPYMPIKQRRKLIMKGGKIPHIQVIEFDKRVEDLIAGASAVVAMGGYNTFCEILSFDKPALIVPRMRPREEQLIRARRAAELGLIDMLLPGEAAEPLRLAAALKALPDRDPPSKSKNAIKLEGLPHISTLVADWLSEHEGARPTSAVA